MLLPWFEHNTQLYLLTYMYIEDELILTLIKLGTHENFDIAI